MKKRSTDDFLSLACCKHGNKYDYSRVCYTTSHGHIEIGCPDHGWFRQKACAHLSYGCKKCGDRAGTVKRTTKLNDFIIRANEKHLDRYNYALVNFHRQHDLIDIICPVHGIFRQAVNDHLKGHGCRQCGVEATGDYRRGVLRTDTEDFIEKAIAVHGQRYDYTKTKFIGFTGRLFITCHIHGEFEQFPSNHLAGNGCPACAQEQNRVSFAEFVQRANAMHDGRYTYSNYTKLSDKVGVVCPDHGFFWQRATDHIFALAGCPTCASIAISLAQTQWLDMLGIADREVHLTMGDRHIKADGYDPETRTVYEFWGDFWHGNPMLYDPEAINPINNIPFGELYQKTLDKRRLITESGYHLIEIWEKDWRKIHANTRQRRIRP